MHRVIQFHVDNLVLDETLSGEMNEHSSEMDHKFEPPDVKQLCVRHDTAH